MKQKEPLTNQDLQGICKSNFELAWYAINLGKYYIKSGHETDIKTVLDEIRRHPNPHYLSELKKMDEFEREEKYLNATKNSHYLCSSLC